MQKALIVTVAVVGLGAPAAAFTLPMIPDFCFIKCVQFTHSTALASIQAAMQQAQQVANELRNLKTLDGVGRVYQQIGGQIGAVTGASGSSGPLGVGDAAAGQVIQQSGATESHVASVDALAQGADGAAQQAQITNLYLSTIATEAAKANELAAERAAQEQNKQVSDQQALDTLFSGK